MTRPSPEPESRKTSTEDPRMPKTIDFDETARRGLEAGMNQLADALRVIP